MLRSPVALIQSLNRTGRDESDRAFVFVWILTCQQVVVRGILIGAWIWLSCTGSIFLHLLRYNADLLISEVFMLSRYYRSLKCFHTQRGYKSRYRGSRHNLLFV